MAAAVEILTILAGFSRKPGIIRLASGNSSSTDGGSLEIVGGESFEGDIGGSVYISSGNNVNGESGANTIATSNGQMNTGNVGIASGDILGNDAKSSTGNVIFSTGMSTVGNAGNITVKNWLYNNWRCWLGFACIWF